MKLDDRKKQTLTARRTLKIFFDAFTEILEVKPFEKVTVSDICNQAMIPRATFYNYFEDKYDLLEYYCTKYMEDAAVIEAVPDEDIKEYIAVALERLLNYLKEKNDIYKKVYITNENGYFMNYMRTSLKKYLMELLANIKDTKKSSMPLDLEAELMSGIVVSLCIWWIYHSDECTISEVLGFFEDKIEIKKNSGF